MARLDKNSLKKWVKEEYNNEIFFSANVKLLRALGLFFGSVIVFRNYGEAIFAA
eukprot:CAMPEP_0175053078 /NCGR_PEP_ID=MMETSP0052_2-20121109/8719_1 /TAXON_ID=51329 ORGANISM="Polytomella parva, Strain SAG 63-3" /NCGR_SAMPLE_ID=MMETSP0052_2 /ASSEMBLY_ACC=CAM_ASM_000194 /LENGTH=53 /DNA_ID=CAMNT_0016317561 /DNA_START=47 /DNA_END=208 /DNA_ORIENTATION=+